MLNSQYLELNSDRALVVTDKVIAKEFEMDGECSFNLRIIIIYCTYMYNYVRGVRRVLYYTYMYDITLSYASNPLYACSPVPA